jgi:hypothetical protein
MQDKDLASFVSELGEISSLGENMRLPAPPTIEYSHVNFKNVKKIGALDELDNEKRFLRYIPLSDSQKRSNATNFLINSYSKRNDIFRQ